MISIIIMTVHLNNVSLVETNRNIAHQNLIRFTEHPQSLEGIYMNQWELKYCSNCKVILTSLLYEHSLVDVEVLVDGTTCEHSKLLLVVR